MPPLPLRCHQLGALRERDTFCFFPSSSNLVIRTIFEESLQFLTFMPTASHLPLIPVVDFIHAISDCFHFYGFHIQFSFPCTLLQPSVPSQLSRNPSSSALSLGWSCFCQISTSCCSLVWALHYLLEDSGSPSSLRMTFRSLAFWL